MKTSIYKCLFLLLAAMTLCMTMSSCRWPWEPDDNERPYVGKDNLSFEATKGDVRELSIVCSGKWTITDVPHWLTAESTEGTGNAMVRFSTCKPNNGSRPNEGYLTVTFSVDAGATAMVRVTQLGAAIASCEVTPNLVVTLSNGIACDFSYDREVARYFRGYIKASSAGKMSQDEIIMTLERDFSRHVPSEDEVADFGGLKAGTRYILYTLAYDSNGDRGDLVATEVSTLPILSNEPVCKISNMRKNGLYWNWTVTKSAACSSYYMMTIEDPDLAFVSDVRLAWCLEYAASQGYISEFVNGTDWKQEVEKGTFFAVWTRGMDKRGNPSGIIDRDYVSYSTTRSATMQKSNGDKDNSFRKPSPDQYKLYRIQ